MDDFEDEDEVDGDHLDYESTDSTASASQMTQDFIINKRNLEAKYPFLIKTSSTSYKPSCVTPPKAQQVRHPGFLLQH